MPINYASMQIIARKLLKNVPFCFKTTEMLSLCTKQLRRNIQSFDAVKKTHGLTSCFTTSRKFMVSHRIILSRKNS